MASTQVGDRENHRLGPAHVIPGKVCRAAPLEVELRCKLERPMDQRFIFSALTGVVCVIVIFAAVTAVRHISHRSGSAISPPSNLEQSQPGPLSSG